MIFAKDISKRYDAVSAIKPMTVTFGGGLTTVLIGQSGCGKSSLLRLLIRLTEPDSGTVEIDGELVTAANVEHIRRKIGYVVQDGGLFPHLTAKENIFLLANYTGMNKSHQQDRAAELAKLVQLPFENLDRYPAALSGGQRQRVSLIRALMLDPKVLLFDEPLGALDPITRSDLQRELKQIFSTLKKTVVLVTHDMGEAAYLADEIILMRSGEIVQQGTFNDLLQNPSDAYVTNFINAQRSPLSPISVPQ